MISAKKIEANQKNAADSTGPTTDEGKRIASMNGAKHQFFSKTLRLKKENEKAEYEELFSALFASLRPSGRMEELEVEEIATGRWHLRNCRRMIQTRINAYQKSDVESELVNFVRRSSSSYVDVPGLADRFGDGKPHPSQWEIREFVGTLTNDDFDRSGSGTNYDVSTDLVSKQTGIRSAASKATSKANRFCLQLRMGQSLDTLLRYEGILQKRVDKALDRLLKLQAVRQSHGARKNAGHDPLRTSILNDPY